MYSLFYYFMFNNASGAKSVNMLFMTHIYLAPHLRKYGRKFRPGDKCTLLHHKERSLCLTYS